MATTTTRFLGLNAQGNAVINLAESLSTGTAFYSFNKLGTGTLNITAAQTVTVNGGTAAIGNGDVTIGGGLAHLAAALARLLAPTPMACPSRMDRH